MTRLTDTVSVSEDQDMTRLSGNLSVTDYHRYAYVDRYCICHK
jgi:hypothetical protein